MLELISTSETLQELLPKIAKAPRIAIDTEADSLHVYKEKLCLIQMGLPQEERQELIDPLANFPLKPFYDALKNKLLILHGADYDLRLLRRSGGCIVKNIFDTMIAARLSGRKQFGYATLVKAEFNVTLPKSSQKANWGRRPLTTTMMTYAQNDTRYLLKLADKLEADLKKLNRYEWFEQACAKAIHQTAIEREKDNEDLWRIQGSGLMRGRALAILRELWHWREEEGREADKPVFYILRNEDLLAVAQKVDSGQPVPAFKHLRGKRQKNYLASIDRAMGLSQEAWPTRKRARGTPRLTPIEEKKAEELKKNRDQIAKTLDLEASLVAPKSTLEAVAAHPETAKELLMPWQLDLLKL